MLIKLLKFKFFLSLANPDKILFQNNIDFNQKDYDGRTALHLAVCENHIDIIKFLINVVKVNQSIKDRWGKIAKEETTNQAIIKLFKY